MGGVVAFLSSGVSLVPRPLAWALKLVLERHYKLGGLNYFLFFYIICIGFQSTFPCHVFTDVSIHFFFLIV